MTSTIDDNPLLDEAPLPRFRSIRPGHVEPAIDRILEENRRRADALLDRSGPADWEGWIAPLEALEQRLARAWSPVAHLHSVADTPELRRAYNACLPKLSAYRCECAQDERRWRTYAEVADRADALALSRPRRRLLENALRDFRLAGAGLADDARARLREIDEELSRLSSRFAENVLDATQAWQRTITDASRLAGLPETALATMAAAARRAGDGGWRITLDAPSYLAVMTHADDRALREEVYEAHATRASDRGPDAGRWDNTPVMARILELRHEKARLLGFDDYAGMALTTRMAPDPAGVVDFLERLAARAVPVARREMDELRAFAGEALGIEPLMPWDVAYASERLKQHRFSISSEALRPYFPIDRVLAGLFTIVGRLYGIEIEEETDVETWHDDVRFFSIREDGECLGRFYLDLYARDHKRGGAWMDECVNRQRRGDGIETPVAYLTCNFTPPTDDAPALLTHDEVRTLFHEFGHGLHHMLTRIDEAAVAGIQGVAWDAVELPSQFMEHWCWQETALPLFSGHHETGAPLPAELLERMLAARNFQAGMRMVRQLEFALFDFRLHHEYDPTRGGDQIQERLDEVRRRVAVVEVPDYHRFAHGFTHVFAGGYAAGYYSYLWAEVLASDAFALFEENGVFDAATGRRFRESILERGGAEDPLDLFRRFRGRDPEIDALLRHSGIAADTETTAGPGRHAR